MTAYGRTDAGRVRPSNQDAFVCGRLSDTAVFAVVCDGMGGANGGNVASSLAIDTFSSYCAARIKDKTIAATDVYEDADEDVNIPVIMSNAADAANTAVLHRSAEDTSLSGMGTTLVAALIINKNMFVLNIGDSRLYLISETNGTQITKDHSYVQYLVDIGRITPEQASKSPYRNIITRAIGKEDLLDADIFNLDISNEKFNYILMCSDGLYNFLPMEDIISILNVEDISIESKAELLVNSANYNGGGDNITVILIRTKENN